MLLCKEELTARDTPSSYGERGRGRRRGYGSVRDGSWQQDKVARNGEPGREPWAWTTEKVMWGRRGLSVSSVRNVLWTLCYGAFTLGSCGVGTADSRPSPFLRASGASVVGIRRGCASCLPAPTPLRQHRSFADRLQDPKSSCGLHLLPALFAQLLCPPTPNHPPSCPLQPWRGPEWASRLRH